MDLPADEAVGWAPSARPQSSSEPSVKGFWHFSPTKGTKLSITITSSLVKPQGQDIAPRIDEHEYGRHCSNILP